MIPIHPHDMKYRRLGNSGLKVSVVSLGSWLTYGGTVGADGARACLRAAVDSGINLIDTADAYACGGAEEVLGDALQEYRRSDVVLATKLFWPMSDNVNDQGLSRKHIMESVTASLRRLKTDYIDLYQCHRFDPDTPIHEVVRAMDDCIRQGKLLYWGVSMWSAEQTAEACRVAGELGACPPISNQPPYNMFERDIEAVDLPQQALQGMSQIVYSPLAQGLLTGKYRAGTVPAGTRAADERAGAFLRPFMTAENIKKADSIADLATELGLKPSQLALAWCLRQDHVASVIAGATKASQVTQNTAAAGVTLSPEVIARIEKILTGTP